MLFRSDGNSLVKSNKSFILDDLVFECHERTSKNSAHKGNGRDKDSDNNKTRNNKEIARKNTTSPFRSLSMLNPIKEEPYKEDADSSDSSNSRKKSQKLSENPFLSSKGMLTPSTIDQSTLYLWGKMRKKNHESRDKKRNSIAAKPDSSHDSSYLKSITIKSAASDNVNCPKDIKESETLNIKERSLKSLRIAKKGTVTLHELEAKYGDNGNLNEEFCIYKCKACNCNIF